MKNNYHPDLRKYRKVYIPIWGWLLPAFQWGMGKLYLLEKEDASVGICKHWVTSYDGYPIPVYEYDSKNVDTDLHIIFYHGGGFVFGSAPQHFAFVRRLARSLACKVYLVDYRLAPKYKFPKAVEDAYAVYTWLDKQATRMVVCGDSAGGNLATAVCLMAKDRGFRMPDAQMLFYPVCDYRMQSQSMQRYVDTPMCNASDMKKYYAFYVESYTMSMYPYLSPLEAPSLEGMPKTYIEVAQYDCLHDEGVEYAQRLKDAKVVVQLFDVYGAMHGYDIAVNSGFMEEIMKKRIAFLQEKGL